MTTTQIRKLYENGPFQPFYVNLADGRSLFVPHPEWISFAPSGRIVIVHQPGDSFEIVDLLLVTGLEVKSNGRGRATGRSQKRSSRK